LSRQKEVKYRVEGGWGVTHVQVLKKEYFDPFSQWQDKKKNCSQGETWACFGIQGSENAITYVGEIAKRRKRTRELSKSAGLQYAV